MDGDGVDGTTRHEDVDEDAVALLKLVGRQIKMWRQAAGMTQTELGTAIGYGEEMVSSVERGVRAPQPEFLTSADRVLGAEGKLAAFIPAVAEARYPRKVRNLAKLEAEAVELGAYANHTIHALLQTEEYTRGLFEMRRPLHTSDVIEQNVSARMARQEIFRRAEALPIFSFVQEEVTLRRPVGGRATQRGQLQRLLDVGRMRNVEIQVMPTDREDHAGLGGAFRLFKLRDGTALGYSENQHITQFVTDPREVHVLEMQYGIIRAQALTPRESLAFIEKVLEETWT